MFNLFYDYIFTTVLDYPSIPTEFQPIMWSLGFLLIMFCMCAVVFGLFELLFYCFKLIGGLMSRG